MGKLLDCTFRDGGYHTNWVFDEAVVKAYSHLFEVIKNIELGYVGKRNRFGDFSVDDYLSFRAADPSVDFYLMTDYSSFDQGVTDKFIKVGCNFRVAVNFDKVLESKPVFDAVKSDNKVCLNLAKFNMLEIKDFERVIREVDSWEVDVIYLADSFGCCTPESLSAYFRCCRDSTGKKIGFHAHDNLGMAHQNSVHALDCGVDMIDCTLGGMGKGAGNCATEGILSHLGRYVPSLDDLSGRFASLREEYGWGTNEFYKLAAANFVNSTYVFRMIADGKSAEHMRAAIPKLRLCHVFDDKVYQEVC